jgi:hypothetical protein
MDSSDFGGAVRRWQPVATATVSRMTEAILTEAF